MGVRTIDQGRCFELGMRQLSLIEEQPGDAAGIGCDYFRECVFEGDQSHDPQHALTR